MTCPVAARYRKREKMCWKISLIILIYPIILLTGCDLIGDVTTPTISIAVAEVADIKFPSRPGATQVLIDVDVKPNGAQVDTAYYVCMLSTDGYFFGNKVVKWTSEELEGPDENERDYEKIKQAEENKIKRVTFGAPANDKALVLLKQDIESLVKKIAENYYRELQSDLKGGDLVDFFKDAGKDITPSREETNRVFNRHLKLVVTDKEGLIKIQYPDGETVLLGDFSGTGSFKTPTFRPKYERLKITWTPSSEGRYQFGVYKLDGRMVMSGSEPVNANKERVANVNVEPEQEYYFSITVPDNMNWTLKIEESNLPSWAD